MRRLLPFVFLLGCADASGATRCEDAHAALSECAGTELESPFTSCNEDEEFQAEELLRELDASGCEGPREDKSDGPLCWAVFWDPFGWCDPPAAPIFPAPTGSTTRYPILLAHGFNTSTTNFWRFNDVDVALEADGHEVVLGSVPPFDASSVRAEFLAEQVDALIADTGAEKVNLVCFSQGGVDCRYLVSPGGLDYGDRVATVSTISSPHRGTYVADALLAVLPEGESASGRVIDAVTSWYGATFSELAGDSHFIDAMESMSEAAMGELNETIGDHPDVYYQSWAGVSHVGGIAHPNRNAIPDACQGLMLYDANRRDVMDPLLVGGAALVAHGTELRPNDGVATVESAIWGEFRGCIPADHLDQVGQIRDRDMNPRTGWDYLAFYRTLAFELADLGY